MRQTSAAIAEWLERGRFANAPEGARPSGWPVAGLAAGRPLKAVVSLLWAPRKEAPVPAVMGWQHGHVGPVWLGEPMFIALGDLEKLFAFRASTKEVRDRNVADVFSPCNSSGPPTFRFRIPQESTPIRKASLRLNFFRRTQARVRHRKSWPRCIVFAS